MRETWRLLWQTALLAGIAWLMGWIVRVTGLPVPGNILGIVVIFALLCCGVLKEQWFDTASPFLLRHMIFFFVPLTVGLMDCYEIFIDSGSTLIVALLVSFFVPLALVGALGSVLYKKVDTPEAPQDTSKETKPCGS